MDDFEREEPSINQSKELESVMDRVISTGRKFENHDILHQNGLSHDQRSLSHHSRLGSRRSMTHQGPRSYRSSRVSQGRLSIKSRGSQNSRMSKLSRKSLRSVQDSLNKIRKASSVASHKSHSAYLKTNKKVLDSRVPDLSAEVKNVTKLRASINTKLNKISNDPSYDKFYRNGALLTLPPVHQPIVSLVDPGRITFVANNDAHTKESNFGYSRNKFGGFYNH